MMQPRQIPAALRTAVALAAAFVLPDLPDALAGQFQNLGFESAVISGPPDPYDPVVLASDALPFWNVPTQYVVYDDIALDAPSISIQDGLGRFPMNPLQGHYSVFLQNSSESYSYPAVGTWISQTGTVPANARSLLFITDSGDSMGQLVVSFNGTAIPVRLYSTGPPVNGSSPVETFIGDLSAYSGRAGELRFDLTPYPLHTGISLDAIQFSTIVVPEPSSLLLLAIGILSLAGYRWRLRR